MRYEKCNDLQSNRTHLPKLTLRRFRGRAPTFLSGALEARRLELKALLLQDLGDLLVGPLVRCPRVHCRAREASTPCNGTQDHRTSDFPGKPGKCSRHTVIRHRALQRTVQRLHSHTVPSDIRLSGTTRRGVYTKSDTGLSVGQMGGYTPTYQRQTQASRGTDGRIQPHTRR